MKKRRGGVRGRGEREGATDSSIARGRGKVSLSAVRTSLSCR